MTIEDLIEKLEEKNPNADTALIRQAYDFAYKAHGDQKRKSGEPYIVHPVGTASILIDLEMDEPTIIAGLLHDVPEDTDVTLQDIKLEFGREVYDLVRGITKLGLLKYRGIEKYLENLRRMFVAMARDIRVIVIKFADRIHNLETLDALPPEKRKRIAMESLEIYAPIANRLGMGEIKGQIEDLAFPHVYPEEYKWLEKKVESRYKEKDQVIKNLTKEVTKILDDNQISYQSIHGRSKHYFSLYQKLLEYNKDLSKIYDLIALRIIVNDISGCYEVLGLIHQNFKPLKGRIKDYIAQPKPNGYKSLHTTVFTSEGEIVEIQIRDKNMHQEAEFGIAAHWHYKEANEKEKIREKTLWIQQLSKMQQEFSDENTYLESLKIDIFHTRIFVFTPKGDVIDLPEGATPIDFAYHIHTEIGHHCNGAKINDQICSLETKLKSGDVVDISTDKNRKGPSEDWIKFVKTNTAKERIKSWINKNRKESLQKILSR
ncbi:RelA/SpoT family protein [Patescibacteria group bacterium]|nr:RelA/SpoT family protein [Patescibacteria group bacterium]